MIGASMAVRPPMSRGMAQMAIDALTRAGATVFWPERAMVFGNPNLLSSPEDFGDELWLKTGATVATNTATAPDGTLTADTLRPDATTNVHHVGVVGTQFASAHAHTIHVKNGGHRFVQVVSLASTNQFATFDTTTGAFTLIGAGVSSALVDVLPDGWYRLRVAMSAGSGSTLVRYVVVPAADSTWQASGLLGDGVNGIHIWGAKLEQGSTATAYTPQSQLRELGIYQDSAGVTPVTALADLIGLALDRTPNENGVAVARYGPELWTPSSADAGVTVGAGTVTFNNVAVSSGVTGTQTLVGKSYLVTYKVTGFVSGGVSIKAGTSGTAGVVRIADGVYSEVFAPTNNTGPMQFVARFATTTLTVSLISVREVRGNHATQATAASKPSIGMVPKRLGPELVVNGAFDADTSWTKGEGWSISGGKAIRSPSSFGSVLSQPISVTAGKSYAVTYTLADRVAGGPNVAFSGGTVVNGPSRTVNGTYSDTLLALPGNNTLRIVTGDNTSSLSFDNISVQEVLEWSPAMIFDPAAPGDFLSVGQNINPAGNFWACIGATVTQTAAFASLLTASNSSTIPPRVQVYTAVGGSLLVMIRDDANTAASLNLGIVSTNTPFVVSIRKVGTTLSARINGGAWQTASIAALGAVTLNQLDIGANRAGGTVSQPLAGSMPFVSFGNATISDADLALAEKTIASLHAQTL